jgi:hypothetical protein
MQISVTQLGQVGDRTYRIKQEFVENAKAFIVKGITNKFVVFFNDVEVASFKTLTKCKEFIKGEIK